MTGWCKIEFGTQKRRKRGRGKPLRLAVEGIGWIGVGLVGLTLAGERWPAFGCRMFGHHPNRWTWATEKQEETTCRHCGATLVRERKGKTETAVAA